MSVVAPGSHAQTEAPIDASINPAEAVALVEGVEAPTAMVQIEMRHLLRQLTRFEGQQADLNELANRLEQATAELPSTAAGAHQFYSAVETSTSNIEHGLQQSAAGRTALLQVSEDLDMAAADLEALHAAISSVGGGDTVLAAKDAVVSAAGTLSRVEADIQQIENLLRENLELLQMSVAQEITQTPPPLGLGAIAESLSIAASAAGAASDRISDAGSVVETAISALAGLPLELAPADVIAAMADVQLALSDAVDQLGRAESLVRDGSDTTSAAAAIVAELLTLFPVLAPSDRDAILNLVARSYEKLLTSRRLVAEIGERAAELAQKMAAVGATVSGLSLSEAATAITEDQLQAHDTWTYNSFRTVRQLKGANIQRYLQPQQQYAAWDTATATETNPLLESAFATADSLTDIQLLATEVDPDLEAIGDGLVRTFAATWSGVYVSDVPQSVQDIIAELVFEFFIQFNTAWFSGSSVTFYSTWAVDTVDELLPDRGCGSPVVVDGYRIWYGTKYADTCTGTPYPETFWVKGGGDSVDGRGSQDQIHLGNGTDSGSGGNGPDFMWGGNGDDFQWGQNGNDILNDRPNDRNLEEDWIEGGYGSDAVDMMDYDWEDTFNAGPGEDVRPRRNKEYDYVQECDASVFCSVYRDTVNMGN